jgi:hypothetical protein
MSPTFTPDPRRIAHHPQRPWRPVESEPRRPSAQVIHRFAAPVVRELPPRRDGYASAGAW